MLKETLSAAQAVEAQLTSPDSSIVNLARQLQSVRPAVALTVARGSSDHAASYFSYLAMSQIGVPVVSLPMSLMTMHGSPLQVKNQLTLGFSQSGRSPDLVDTMHALAKRGALTVALVNDVSSPLASICQHVVPLMAWPEHSVAATKSFIATQVAAARLIAYWANDVELLKAIGLLPTQLQQAARLDWSTALSKLAATERMMVLGRGLGYSIASEAALKLKETSSIQAEAYSSAEVRHGPMTLIDQEYPLLVFALRGPEQAGLISIATEMRARGAKVLLAAPSDIPSRDLTLATAAHIALDPILAIQTFYVMAAALSELRGMNPDTPRHLSKVTCTH